MLSEETTLRILQTHLRRLDVCGRLRGVKLALRPIVYPLNFPISEPLGIYDAEKRTITVDLYLLTAACYGSPLAVLVDVVSHESIHGILGRYARACGHGPLYWLVAVMVALCCGLPLPLPWGCATWPTSRHGAYLRDILDSKRRHLEAHDVRHSRYRWQPSAPAARLSWLARFRTWLSAALRRMRGGT